MCSFSKPLVYTFILKWDYRKSCAPVPRSRWQTHTCVHSKHGSLQVVQSKDRTEFKTFDRGRIRCPERKTARARAGAGEGAHWVLRSGGYWWIMSGCGGEMQTSRLYCTHEHTLQITLLGHNKKSMVLYYSLSCISCCHKYIVYGNICFVIYMSASQGCRQEHSIVIYFLLQYNTYNKAKFK